MKTQTKYTRNIGLLFLLELIPLPWTAMYALYAVRKRPAWLPDAVNQLYSDPPMEAIDEQQHLAESDRQGTALKTRMRCTIALVALLIIDLDPFPITLPFALYIVRKRPIWFKNVITRLYADISEEEY